ncbi:MAG: biotin--[acetyl-CoA-carboxylase] ligase [Ancrocorticia sp.]
MAQESQNADLSGGNDAIAFPLTQAQASVLLHTELTASTQDDLASLWRTDTSAQPFTALIADNQTAGRGRVGRPWYSATGRSVLISVLLALPASLRDQIGWLTLIGGAAARAAVETTTVASSATVTTTERNNALISWPNDVVVMVAESDPGQESAQSETAKTPTPRKVAGIIGEYVGERDGQIFAVLGMGLNLSLTADELPTPTSASLLTAGLPVPSRDEVMAAWLAGLRSRIEAFTATNGNPETSGILGELNSYCETLRPGVTVGRPRNTPIHGTGQAILADGSLQVLTDEGVVVVSSGEVSLLDTARHS